MIITAAAPVCSAWTLSSTVSRVDSAAVPATTGDAAVRGLDDRLDQQLGAPRWSAS